MKRTRLLSAGLALTALLLSAVAPACSSPGEEALDQSGGESAYTTEGTCDGLPRLKNLQTPPGICVGLVSAGFAYARGIAQLDTGDLVVAEMGGWTAGRGGVWLLRQKADKTFEKTKLASQIDRPTGIAVGPDGLVYVAAADSIVRLDPYAATLKTDPSKKLAKTGRLAGPDAYTAPPLKVVVSGLPPDGRHPAKKLVFDKRDPWTIYVNVGSGTDACGTGAAPPSGFPFPCPEVEGGEPRGAIRKYVLAGPEHLGGAYTTMARGLRNSTALAVHPTSNLLVQGENSRDSISRYDASLADQEGDLPHEELNVVVEGGHYGWPYCYDNGAPNPEYLGRVDCANYKKPALLLPGHAAPLGMTFYTGSLLPTAYRNNLIVTFHGYRDNGHRLMLVPVDAQGVPGTGAPLDIIRGWDAAGSDPQGSPVDVIGAKDGSLYVTEDKNGDVLRVFYDARLGDGAPLQPIVRPRTGISADERARCDALSRRTDAFSKIQRDVIDTTCVSCHGTGPGYAGDLALLPCDAVGNAQRLTKARSGGLAAYAVPRDLSSELLLRLKGQGFPQMPSGGLSAAQIAEVEDWVRNGAVVPQ